jgi:hypothetical protein
MTLIFNALLFQIAYFKHSATINIIFKSQIKHVIFILILLLIWIVSRNAFINFLLFI